MSETISVRFRLTKQEIASAVRAYYLRSPKFVARILGFIIFISVGLFALFAVGILNAFSALGGFFGLVLWAACLLYLLPHQMYRRFPKILEDCLWVFSGKEINCRTNDLDARVQWELYKKVLETEMCYLLVQDGDMFSVIPRRTFVDAK